MCSAVFKLKGQPMQSENEMRVRVEILIARRGINKEEAKRLLVLAGKPYAGLNTWLAGKCSISYDRLYSIITILERE